MGIVEESIKESIDIWNQCVNTKFLVEMQNGSLKEEIFLKYLIQDSLYLRDYIKTYSYAFIGCNTWKQMKFVSSAINYVNDNENLTRINYLKKFNVNDDDIDNMQKTKECENYTKFLIDTGKSGDVPSILMAVLPCMLEYHYVFKKVSEKSPNLLNGYYSDLINDYINDNYVKVCEQWTNFTNDFCENSSKDKILKLKVIFREASMHELLFWEMLEEKDEPV